MVIRKEESGEAKVLLMRQPYLKRLLLTAPNGAESSPYAVAVFKGGSLASWEEYQTFGEADAAFVARAREVLGREVQLYASELLRGRRATIREGR